MELVLTPREAESDSTRLGFITTCTATGMPQANNKELKTKQLLLFAFLYPAQYKCKYNNKEYI